jgi:hypothetical protein
VRRRRRRRRMNFGGSVSPLTVLAFQVSPGVHCGVLADYDRARERFRRGGLEPYFGVDALRGHGGDESTLWRRIRERTPEARDGRHTPVGIDAPSGSRSCIGPKLGAALERSALRHANRRSGEYRRGRFVRRAHELAGGRSVREPVRRRSSDSAIFFFVLLLMLVVAVIARSGR